ncbi:MAG: sulfotransferase [Chloroflexi bacterium]|nr:sulfotransferase [Chloroflexota bacterium]
MKPAKLPAPVRAFNWGGRQLRRAGIPLARLDERSLLDAARKRTGFDDFGGETFKVGLGKLIESWEKEARLSTLGRFIARTDTVDLLASRLQIVHAFKEHPEIAMGKVARPIVIIGMPRTGTSILHELMAQGPNLRTPLSWEVARPIPPPEKETYETDPRIAEVDKKLAQTDRILPHFKKMHPMGARLPQECVAITSHEFASMLFPTFYHMPGYTRWLHNEANMAPAYAFHRRMLQLLQWHCPGERWVLKSPGHLWSLEALMAEYPDACLIQTHRDPIKILASLVSLVSTLQLMTSRFTDPLEAAREWSEHIAVALDRSVTAREKGVIPGDQVIDVQFDTFMADPFAAIREIYDRFGLRYTPEAESRMRRFLAANPDDKHGKHTYRFADTGLDLVEERRKVQRYQEFFGVRSEVKL